MKVLEVKSDLSYRSLATEDRSKLKSLVRRLNNPLDDFDFPPFYEHDLKELKGNFYQMIHH